MHDRALPRPPSYLLALICCVTLLACGSKGEDPKDSEARASETSPAQAVSLIIQPPDGQAKTYPEVPWTEALTVQGLLDAQRGAGVTYTASGSGETALLTALNGVSTKGADQRSWLFWVNGQFGDKSFGAYTLKPGDTVEWRFALYEDAKK